MPKQGNDHRKTPRLKLPPMYTLIRVRPHGDDKFCWTGHIYDVSVSGMRFELDSSLEPGTEIDIHAMLPGSNNTTVNASGHIIRCHDEPDELGPIRMGMIFDKFTRPIDRKRLTDYLRQNSLRKAA